MDKVSVRKQKLNERKLLSKDEVILKSDLIKTRVLSLDRYRNSDIILAYCDAQNEVMTLDIVSDSLNKGKRVYYPKVDKENLIMDFYRVYNISELSSGYFKIPEPSGLSEKYIYDETSDNVFMLVPGVAFDEDLYRAGYGKGFYDKYLDGKANIIKCGLCFEIQFANSVCPDSNDIRMDYIISEDRIINGIN